MIGKPFTARAAAIAAVGAAALAPLLAAGVTPVPAQAQPVTANAPLDPPPGTPLPSTVGVAGMLTRLTDAGVGYKEKGNLIENGINQQDGHALDHDLRKAYRDGALPYTFNVQNVSPTTPGHAIAPTEISGPKTPMRNVPIELIDQGSWVITQQSAKALMAILEGR